MKSHEQAIEETLRIAEFVRRAFENKRKREEVESHKQQEVKQVRKSLPE